MPCTGVAVDAMDGGSRHVRSSGTEARRCQPQPACWAAARPDDGCRMRGGITGPAAMPIPGLEDGVEPCPGGGARPETEQVPGSRFDLGASGSGGMKATTSDRSTIRPSEKNSSVGFTCAHLGTDQTGQNTRIRLYIYNFSNFIQTNPYLTGQNTFKHESGL